MINCKLDLNAIMVDNSAGGSPALLFVYFLSSILCNECYKDKQDWTATFFCHLESSRVSANLKQTRYECSADDRKAYCLSPTNGVFSV